MSQGTGWRPDPYGLHEFRFFSADGQPTLLVMDGGQTSHERPPPTAPSSVPGPVAQPVTPAVSEPNPQPHVTSVAAAPPTEGPKRPQRGAIPVVHDSFVDRPTSQAEAPSPEPLSRALKIGYGIITAALALSALGLAYVHLHHNGGGHSTVAGGTTTTSSAPHTSSTTVALPTALKPTADAAASALVSSWGTGNRAAALTVATPAAVSTLFAMHYSSGLAEDRGCSTSFSPLVCTFGPPAGATPTDPIYEISVSQAPGGWYVSSITTEN